jgi:hypothetical protein
MIKKQRKGLLNGARVYLSGPMDFVASRAAEKKYGWRNRVSEFLHCLGVTVFDPWNKPDVRGFHEYGREDVRTAKARERWTFEDSPSGAQERARCSGGFWQTLHIDLRMVDTSDFVIAYCPTNIYSVGTPHEIITCRQQRKPVLFVSPRVAFPALKALRSHVKSDKEGARLLKRLTKEVPIKENPLGVPSLWYMPLVGGESFFDGFGFADYRDEFGWERIPLDANEKKVKPKRPLLRFLEDLNKELPKKWDNRLKKYIRNDDWLLWELRRKGGREADVMDARLMEREEPDQS